MMHTSGVVSVSVPRPEGMGSLKFCARPIECLCALYRLGPCAQDVTHGDHGFL